MKKFFTVIFLINLLVTGCVGQKVIGNSELLEFITDGQTTRTEIILKLGQPSASFESEGILTYRIGGYMQNGYFVRENQQSWSQVNQSLVLVFGVDGILQTHSLVRIR